MALNAANINVLETGSNPLNHLKVLEVVIIAFRRHRRYILQYIYRGSSKLTLRQLLSLSTRLIETSIKTMCPGSDFGNFKFMHYI